MMIIISYIVLIIVLLQLSVALSNFIFKPNLRKSEDFFHEKVSVMIPARNEEKNIGNLLEDLIEQDYTNIEVLVYNDHSQDSTGNITKSYMQKDGRIRMIDTEELPEGWLGKTHACHCLSEAAIGDYYLFLDADVRINGDIICNTLRHMRRHNLGLLSIFPLQKMLTIGEMLAVPLMHYILLSLLPLALVRRTQFPSLSAANGQFMLFQSMTYKRLLPHKAFRNNIAEDIHIARYLKGKKVKVDCLVGDDRVNCRMYGSYSDAVKGFSKNISAFFGNSNIAGIFFWILTGIGFLTLLLALPGVYLLYYIIAMTLTRLIISHISGQGKMMNIMLHLPQQFAMAHMLCTSIKNNLRNKYIWKGRQIDL